MCAGISQAGSHWNHSEQLRQVEMVTTPPPASACREARSGPGRRSHPRWRSGR